MIYNKKFLAIVMCSLFFTATAMRKEPEPLEIMESSIESITNATKLLEDYLSDPKKTFKAMERDLEKAKQEYVALEKDLKERQEQLDRLERHIKYQDQFLHDIEGANKTSLGRAIKTYDDRVIPFLAAGK